MGPVSDTQSPWYMKPKEYVMAKCAFYQCNECSKPFYGGLIDCERDQRNEGINKEDLICKKCSLRMAGDGRAICALHGDRHIVWKFHKCCRPATFKCGGINYLCTRHHDIGGPLEDCGGVDCPLGVKHPPPSHNGRKGMHAIGCSVCMSLKPENSKEEII